METPSARNKVVNALKEAASAPNINANKKLPMLNRCENLSTIRKYCIFY